MTLCFRTFSKKFNLLLIFTIPSTTPHPVDLYELYISEGKVIKMKLLKKAKQKAFFSNNVNAETQGAKYKHTQKMKLKEHYPRQTK